MKILPLFCLPFIALASCQHAGSSSSVARAPNAAGPSVPTNRELAQDRNWIPCGIKADWVYLENAPAGYRFADWVPLPSGSYEWNKGWADRQPRRKFADGPGTLWLRKEELSVGTMFQMDNDLLEVTGDWRHGRLMRAVKIRGAGELAQRQLNWDAINAGLGAGVVAMTPFVWTGAKMAQAIKEGGRGEGAAGESGSGPSPELQRFYQRNRGGMRTFTVVKDDEWSTTSSEAWVTLRDQEAGKEWRLCYSPGFTDQFNRGSTGGLTMNNESLVGAKVEVHFHGDGEPQSIQNLSNGNTCRVKDWKVTGFGW